MDSSESLPFSTESINTLGITRRTPVDEITRSSLDRMLIDVEHTPPSTSSSPPTSNDSRSKSSPQTSDDNLKPSPKRKKSVLFDDVTIYHFNRSQGFISIPSQGGSTLGMKRRHFMQRKLSIDLYEEARRRSRREILLKIKFDQTKEERNCEERLHCGSASSSSSSNSNLNFSDSDEESYSDYSDISDSELQIDSCIFLQPIGAKLRRSLLRASGVGRIDPKEKKECKTIRDSRERSGCKCVGHCIPEYCECTRLGVNCHVDRASYPCGCISSGCRNPLGRTEFDTARVRVHFEEKVINSKNSFSSPEDTFMEKVQTIATTTTTTTTEPIEES